MNLQMQVPTNDVAGLPAQGQVSGNGIAEPIRPVRKFSGTVQPGRTEYLISHNLGTEDVLVQTRIAGRIREGGISIVDENTVRLTFGGVLNEPMDVVVVG